MDETRTILQAAIPALRSASSKLDRRSRCFPTPLVRNIFFATNAMGSAELRCLRPKESEKISRLKISKHAQGSQSISLPSSNARSYAPSFARTIRNAVRGNLGARARKGKKLLLHAKENTRHERVGNASQFPKLR